MKLPRFPFPNDTSFALLAALTLLVPLFFTLNTYEHYETVKFALWMFIVGALVLVFGFRKKTDSESATRKTVVVYEPWYYVLLGLFLVVGLFSALYSLDVNVSFFGFYTRFDNGWIFYALWAALIFFLLQNVTREKYIFLLRILILDSLVVAAYGIMQSLGFAFYTGPTTQLFQRAPSLLGNPDFSSMFIVLALPLVLVFMVQANRRWSKFYYALTALAIIFCTVVLSSRGALVALLGSLLLCVLGLWLFRVRRTYLYSFAAVFGLALLASGLFFSLVRPTVLQATVELNETNISQRIWVWETAWQGIKQWPWLGSGLGNFSITFEHFRPIFMSDLAGVFDDAHNLFINLAATGGILFVLLFVALLLYPVIRNFLRLEREKDPLVLAGMGSIAAFIIAACFTPVVIPCFLFMAIVLCGLLLPLSKQITWNKGAIFSGVFKTAGSLIMLAALVFIVAEHLFFAGRQEYLYNQNYALANRLLVWAVDLNPTNQLYRLYRTAARIELQGAPAAGQVAQTVAVHPLDSNSWAEGARLDELLYERTGQKQYIDAAVVSMRRSISLDLFAGYHYALLSYYITEQGQLGQAKEMAKTSLDLYPDNVPPWLLLARIYQLDGKWKSVEATLDSVAKKYPQDEFLHLMDQRANQDPKAQQVPIYVPPLQPALE